MLDTLQELLLEAGDREVIVVAHHPLASHGTAGGFYDWRDHLFPSIHIAEWLWIPTPVLGSLYPLLRANVFRSGQTLHGTDYADMIQCLSEALSTKKPLIYASGHDHGLQVLEGGDAASYLLVSAIGYGQKGTAVSHGNNTLFAHLHAGFMVVDFIQEGGVVLRVVEPDHPAVVFQKTLKESW